MVKLHDCIKFIVNYYYNNISIPYYCSQCPKITQANTQVLFAGSGKICKT